MKSRLREILIVSTGLDSKYDNVIKSASDDKYLVENINKYRKMLETNNIDIFKQVDNVLVTENGYFLAIYADAVDKIIE